jgi:hypothetical protein
MTATVFLAICILGCDFLLYFLYQWTYGERRRGRARRSRARKTIVEGQNVRPFLASRNGAVRPKQNLHVMRAQTVEKPKSGYAPLDEQLAYRRIASSFAQAKR